jgi:tetratricopeptide (TPR) repeat protein
MSPERTANDGRIAAGLAAALAVAVLVTYAPVVDYGFVSYDDPEYVVDNVHVHDGVTWRGVVWSFTQGHSANWHPLTWLSHMVDWQLYGDWAGGHHVTSVVLHAANAALLLIALWSLTGAVWRSAMVAALFALHPLRVESVAWVAERKDVLSAFGWFLALFTYARYVRSRSRAARVAVAVAVALALLAKPMAVTLPLALLLLDVWPLGRVPLHEWDGSRVRALVVEKLPLFGLAAMTALVTYRVQAGAGAVMSLANEPLVQRVREAVCAYVIYLRRMLWPDDLAFFYPPPAEISPLAWGGALALLAVVTALAVRERTRRPYLLVGWLWFVGTLVPVIGIVRAGEQFMADRFTYVPSVGLCILVVWTVADALPRRGARVAGALGLAAVLLAASASRAQLSAWRDSRTLYTRALAVTTGNHVADGNLGLLLLDEGHTAEAFEHLQRAAQARPASPKAQMNYGVGLAAMGRLDEAIGRYELATRIEPRYAAAYMNLGKALADEGHLEDAERRYREALAIDPEYAKAYAGLGLVLVAEGRTTDGIEAYRGALRLAPGAADVHNNLALALEHEGAGDEALAEYRESVRLDPHEVRSRFNLAAVLLGRGAYEESVQNYRVVIEQQPDLVEAYEGLGVALEGLGKRREARAAYSEALRRRPGWTQVETRLARLDAAGDVPDGEPRP